MADDDFYGSAFGSVYSAYMERPWLARPISRVLWGGDLRPYYAAMGVLGETREGDTVLDCPCGAGPAFRAIPRGRGLRYVAVDLSPSMLRRAGRRAGALGAKVECVRAKAEELPLEAGSADLFLSFWGLHCYADPAAALAEAARVLRPGGRLVGSAFVRGTDTLRQRLLVRPGIGGFGNVPTGEEVEAMLGDAGFAARGIERHGPMVYFDAS
ncbi:MAG TPA: class I SAM-dependent methyltransferase [Micromonospora sp.]